MESSKHQVDNRNDESTIQIVFFIIGCNCVVCYLLTNNEIVEMLRRNWNGCQTILPKFKYNNQIRIK